MSMPLQSSSRINLKDEHSLFFIDQIIIIIVISEMLKYKVLWYISIHPLSCLILQGLR